jgi:uncharacterized protein YfaP (DUF2135 family)
LDVDDRDGYGPENVYWESDAPAGQYTVKVHYYPGSDKGTARYKVLVVIDGSGTEYSGSISYDVTKTITTFTMQ